MNELVVRVGEWTRVRPAVAVLACGCGCGCGLCCGAVADAVDTKINPTATGKILKALRFRSLTAT